MTHLSLFHTTFEERRFATLTIDGRAAWVAREIGTVLGYTHDGKRFVSRIRGEWADEFIAGHDYTLLEGDALAAIKPHLGDDYQRVNSLLVLFETGLMLGLTLTSRPVGRRLRRFLADEVLPKLARGQEPAAPRSSALGRMLAHPATLAWAREARLSRRVDLDDRRFRASSLRDCVRLLHAMGRLDDDGRAEWEVRAVEVAFGVPMFGLRGEPPTAPPLACPACMNREAA